jgi:hypothetical protein
MGRAVRSGLPRDSTWGAVSSGLHRDKTSGTGSEMKKNAGVHGMTHEIGLIVESSVVTSGDEMH